MHKNSGIPGGISASSSSSSSDVSEEEKRRAALAVSIELWRGSNGQMAIAFAVYLFVVVSIYLMLSAPIDASLNKANKLGSLGGLGTPNTEHKAWHDKDKLKLAYAVLGLLFVMVTVSICLISFALRGYLWHSAWKQHMPSSAYAKDKGYGWPFLIIGLLMLAISVYIHSEFSSILPWDNLMMYLLAAGMPTLYLVTTYKNREQADVVAYFLAPPHGPHGSSMAHGHDA